MTLKDLEIGKSAVIRSVGGKGALRQHFLDMGMIPGAEVTVESGVDDAGNTFQTGTIDVDGTTYAWRVSAIALSSVYDITGLPDTAVYVGVRMTP